MDRSEFSIWTVFLHLLLFMISCNVAQDQCEGLTVFSGNRRISTSSVCRKQYTAIDCIQFAMSLDQSHLPRGYPVSSSSVEKPSYISLEGLDSLYRGYIFPGTSITWRSPLSEYSRQKCYGYLLVLNYKSITYNTDCVLLLMKNGTNTELQFQYDLPYVQENTDYIVKVYSMPPYPAKQKDDKETFASMSMKTPNWRSAAISPGNWTPSLAYNTFNDGTIKLKITLPPADYNITHFSIYLKNVDQNIITAEIPDFVTELRTPKHTQASVKIKGTTSGNHIIIVWVKDEYHKIIDMCRCWVMLNDEKTCLNACGGIQTSPFNLNITT